MKLAQSRLHSADLILKTLRLSRQPRVCVGVHAVFDQVDAGRGLEEEHTSICETAEVIENVSECIGRSAVGCHADNIPQLTGWRTYPIR